MNEELLTACEAVLDALEGIADMRGIVIWIRPPFQAAGIHESAQDRLREVIRRAKVDNPDPTS